jgi:hypothetical protein
MLSKAPKQQQQEMEGEEESMPSLTKEQAADLKIASSILTTAFLSEEGEQALVTAIDSPEPAKAVAVMISQLIEMAQTESGQTNTPLDPTVWLMEEGAIDEASDDIEKVAEANGIVLPDDFEEMVIDEVAQLLSRRSESIQQGQGSQPPQAPAGPAPMMGGMPNGMG